MRGRLLNVAAIGRLFGFIAVAAAMVAAAVHFRDGNAGTARHAGVAAVAPHSDPLASELERCRSIGMAAKDDADCVSAWAENRRRFFTYRASPERSGVAATHDSIPQPEGK